MKDLDGQEICPICLHAIQDGDNICPCCRTNLDTMMPSKPSMRNRLWQLLITVPVFLFGLIALMILGTKILAPALFLIVLSGYFLYTSIEGHSEDCRLYNLAQADQKQYIEEAQKRYHFMVDEEKRERILRYNSTPTCPKCHSKSFVRYLEPIEYNLPKEVWDIAAPELTKKWECTLCHIRFNDD